MDFRADDIKIKEIKRLFYFSLFFSIGLSILADPSWAVTVASLQNPIQELKIELFGGWMMAIKIIAAAIGIVISVFRTSLLPFGIGAGLSVGIHFFDRWLGTGAAGALI